MRRLLHDLRTEAVFLTECQGLLKSVRARTSWIVNKRLIPQLSSRDAFLLCERVRCGEHRKKRLRENRGDFQVFPRVTISHHSSIQRAVLYTFDNT